MNLEQHLRVVPDFPKPGIQFLDISPLLEDPQNLTALIEQMAEKAQAFEFSKIVGIESRGFILGAALAAHMKKGFVMIRKKGKLPGETVQMTYDLEYGTDTIEMLPQSVKKGEKVLVLDDVLATGGTAKAAIDLVEKLEGEVSASLFMIELGFLEGRQKLTSPIESLIIR